MCLPVLSPRSITLCGVKSTHHHPRGKGPSLAHAAAIPLILLEQR